MSVPSISSDQKMIKALPMEQRQSQMSVRIWPALTPHRQRQLAQRLSILIQRRRTSLQNQEGVQDDKR